MSAESIISRLNAIIYLLEYANVKPEDVSLNVNQSEFDELMDNLSYDDLLQIRDLSYRGYPINLLSEGDLYPIPENRRLG